MSTSMIEGSRAPWDRLAGPWATGSRDAWWTQHREAAFNWLALGLLLAAWNASDNDAPRQAASRPAALRGYSSVTVRAATLHPSIDARR